MWHLLLKWCSLAIPCCQSLIFSKPYLTLRLILNITPDILTWTQFLIFLFYTDRFSSKCTPICHNIKSSKSWSELHWSSCYVLPGRGMQMDNAWPAPPTQTILQSKSIRQGNSHPDGQRNSQVVNLSSKFTRSRPDQSFVDHAGITPIHGGPPRNPQDTKVTPPTT